MQSSLAKLLFALIVVTVCFGGVLIWWFGTNHIAPGSQGQFPQTGSNSGPDNSPITPSGSNTTSVTATSDASSSPISSSPIQPAKTEQAYQGIFTQLGATKITFQSVTASSTGDSKALYSLYAADIKAQRTADAAADTALDMAFVDLTGDGAPEALVYEDLPYFCGTDGCALDIYKKSGTKWSKIYSTFVSGDVGATNTIVNGYLDLYLTVQVEGINNQSVMTLYRWDGTTYRPNKVVAAWDGHQFAPAQ
jgi:hypothetical protein